MNSTTTSTSAPPIHQLTPPPNNFYDSLPYIDQGYDEDSDLHAQVVALIGQEMQSSSTTRFKTYKDMVEQMFPTQPTSDSLTFAKSDYEAYTTTPSSTTDGTTTTTTRTTNQIHIPTRIPYENSYVRSLPNPTPNSLLDLNIPSNPSDLTEPEWYALLDQLSISIEYYQKHLTSLELLRRYGKDQWVNAIQDSIVINKQLNNGIDNLSQNIEYIHKVRRYRQEMVKDELEQIKESVFGLIRENKALEDKVVQQQKIKQQYEAQQHRQQQRHIYHDSEDNHQKKQRSDQ